MKLHKIAHSRTGDKGDISDISVIAYDPADYEFIKAYLTSSRVKEYFTGIVHGEVERYEIPGMSALKFVMHEALGGGVTRTLNLDPHGKSLSSSLLNISMPDIIRH